MKENKSSISQAQSYLAMGEFWDSHDLSEFWESTEPVEFEVAIRSEIVYYAVEPGLATKLQALAEKRGVSAETLLNLWLQEKVTEGLAMA